MKKSLKMTLLLVTLGLLLIALWFTTSHPSDETTSNEAATPSNKPSTNENTPSSETNPSSTNTLISVLALEPSEVDYITVSVGNDSLDYVSGEENWSIKGHEDLNIDQSGLNYKAKKMIHVEGLSEIKDANLAEYGLDAPAKKATYHLKDGSTAVLSVGNLSLDQTCVYIMLDSNPTTVYVTNSILYNCLIGDIDSYRTKELENYESAAIYNLAISGSDFENIALSLSKEQNGYAISYDLETDTLKNVLANTYSVDQLFSSLPNFKINNFVADDVTDLSTYGLDNPKLHLVVDYYEPTSTTSDTPSSENDFEIVGKVDYIWGNTLDNGEIAFMKSGDTSVYSMDASFLTKFKECAKPFYLVSKYLALPHINTVQAIDVVFEDAKYHLTMDEANQKYTLENKEMDKATFKKLYRNICNLNAEIELQEASTDQTIVASITYTLTDGSTINITLTPSVDNQYYQTHLNDVLLVGVTKAQIANLKDTLKAAKAGEDFKDIY